eukprot:GSMAST32.ASY1.ANO1.2229.1 assembled CDS
MIRFLVKSVPSFLKGDKKWLHIRQGIHGQTCRTKNNNNDIDDENFLLLLSNSQETSPEVLSAFAVRVKETIPNIDALCAVNLLNSDESVIIDVRSPSEFLSGHICNAFNVPLFSDKERECVGTTFKTRSRESALTEGMDIVRPKLSKLKEKVAELLGGQRKVVIYCSRGGMRSHSFAFLLQRRLPSAKTFVLTGGYKSFKRWAREMYCYVPNTQWPINYPSKQPKVIIITGRTGSGKTRIIHALRDKLGKQVLDLEGIAMHNGSAFGSIGHGNQPTKQQFMNNIAIEWSRLNENEVVFIEDEGPNIGQINLPLGLYRLMQTAPIIIKLVVPRASRLSILIQDYYANNIKISKPSADWFEKMANATRTLERRLGRERCNEMLELLAGSNFRDFADKALHYYDRLYDKQIFRETRTSGGSVMVDVVVDPACTDMNIEEVAKMVIKEVDKLNQN